MTNCSFKHQHVEFETPEQPTLVAADAAQVVKQVGSVIVSVVAFFELLLAVTVQRATAKSATVMPRNCMVARRTVGVDEERVSLLEKEARMRSDES